MKIKLAIIYGICIWALIYILTKIISPIFTKNLSNFHIIIPIIMIIVIGFFGILYIRNIVDNEVIEGFFAGLIFILVDSILDLLIFIIPHNKNILVNDYPFHIISMIIITLLITTFLGYLAQMKIDLK